MVFYKLNNPGVTVDPDNMMNLGLGLCCEGQGTICQSKLVIDPIGTPVSITVLDRAGVAVTTAVTGATTKDGFREALIKAIKAAGGFLANGGIKINIVATEWTIIVEGTVKVTSMNNGSARAFTQLCTEAYTCDAQLFVPYGTSQVVWNGASGTLSGITAATTAATVKASLDAITTPTVNTVVADLVRGGYKVNLTMKSTDLYYIGGVGPEIKNCFARFTA